MLYPYTLPAACVFDKEERAKNVQCMCGQQCNLEGERKLVVWTHKAGSEERGWFLACEPECFLVNVSMGRA